MKRSITCLFFYVALVFFGALPREVLAQGSVSVAQAPRERLVELELALKNQDPGNVFLNPVKHAIRQSVLGGVSIETIVLLILLPLVATIIAGARHLVGLRGFGILLPAALSVVFLEMGPVLGIALFLFIVFVSTLIRLLLKKTKIKLQYLPRMALILWSVSVGVLGVLLASSFVKEIDFSDVALVPILILVLLSEDFTRVQLGKSAGVAVSLTSETLILALVSFAFLSLTQVQYFALLNPEITLFLAAILDILLGRYVGLRLVEYWRFRGLLKK